MRLTNTWTAGYPAFQGDTATVSLCFNIFIQNVASVLQVALPNLTLSLDKTVLGQIMHLRLEEAVTVTPPNGPQQDQQVCYNGNGKDACFQPKEVCIKDCQTRVRLQQAADERNVVEQKLADQLRSDRRT